MDPYSAVGSTLGPCPKDSGVCAASDRDCLGPARGRGGWRVDPVIEHRDGISKGKDRN